MYLYSGKGTNFREAAAEIRKLLKQMDDNKASQHAANICVKWNAIPLATPLTGGAWKRFVYSTKTTLYVLLKNDRQKKRYYELCRLSPNIV